MDKILTDNAGEAVRINWDGERFALIHHNKLSSATKVILLTPLEALDMVVFVKGVKDGTG